MHGLDLLPAARGVPLDVVQYRASGLSPDERTRALLTLPSLMPEEFTRARSEQMNEREVFRGHSPANSKWNLGVARRDPAPVFTKR